MKLPMNQFIRDTILANQDWSNEMVSDVVAPIYNLPLDRLDRRLNIMHVRHIRDDMIYRRHIVK